MIFLDTNVFLRAIVEPTTPETQRMAREMRELFRSVQRGEQEVTTTEVVLHEVVYVLAAKAHFGRTPADIAADLRPILRLRGFAAAPRAETALSAGAGALRGLSKTRLRRRHRCGLRRGKRAPAGNP